MTGHVWQGLSAAAVVLALSGVAAAQGVQVIKTGDGKNVNVISNSGSGVGNSISISGDGSGSTTIINGMPNGVGNKLIIDGKNVLHQPGLLDNNKTMPEDIKQYLNQDVDKWIPESAKPFMNGLPGMKQTAPDAKAKLCYKGEATKFWQFKTWCCPLSCYLYWDAQTLAFYRYHADEDCYRAVDWAALPAVTEEQE